MIITTSIVSIFVFSFLILLLVVMLNIAEKKLLPQGDAKILINGDNDKSPIVKPGGTLIPILLISAKFAPLLPSRSDIA